MTDVVGVKFKDVGKMYYFSPGENEVKLGDNVIVETARGLEFGTICKERTSVDESELVAPLKSIIRMSMGMSLERISPNTSSWLAMSNWVSSESARLMSKRLLIWSS